MTGFELKEDEKEKFFKDAIKLLQTLTTPIFLAGHRQKKISKLILYVSDKINEKTLKKEIKRANIHLNINIKCIVTLLDSEKLNEFKSLNELLIFFDVDEILWDPTNCINRVLSLINIAKDLRAKFDKKLENILLEPWSRTLYLELNPDNYFDDNKVAVPILKSTEQDIFSILKENMGDGKFFPSVRIGFDKPNVSVVAVDDDSFETEFIPSRSSHRLAFAALMMAVFWGVHSVMPYASELPLPYLKEKKEISSSEPNGNKSENKSPDLSAVSKTNFKTEISAGNVDGEAIFNFSGALAFPIRKRFGGQFELLGQSTDGEFMRGAGGHLFWRNPESSLLGLTAAHVGNDDYNLTRLGVESELYLEQFTLFAGSGYQFSDFEKDNPFYMVDLRWYITDDIALTASSEYFNDDMIYRLNCEYMPGFEALPGLTIFADGAFGDDDYDSVRFGFRYYFGDEKTLKRRHREDDPRNTLPMMMFNLQKDIKNHKPAPKPYG